MRLIVFLGPTLPVREAAAILPATYLPPVSQGDVYRAARDRPLAIGIVDGYFERVPAVWHKEILWAMSQGIHCFGAASMGALRAAELADFGMVGVGAVFESLRRGELEDDDEVTVAHAPAEGGYAALSEAMVNIRATLGRAELEGAIGPAARVRLEALAKGLHYPQRTYPRLLELGAGQGLAPAELSALASWLARARVDRKGADARAMLRAMGALAESRPGPKRVDYRFERTDAWEQVALRSGRQTAAARPDALPEEVLLDELRLEQGGLALTLEQSLARALALRESDRLAPELDRSLFRDTFERFFAERGRRRPEQIRAWMAEQGLDQAGLVLLLQREMRIQWIRRLYAQDAMGCLADQLRVSGAYRPTVERAWRKQQLLAAQGLDNPSLAAAGMSEETLLHWFFVARRGGTVPDDLEVYAQTQGFANRLAMIQALLREYYFVVGSEADAGPGG